MTGFVCHYALDSTAHPYVNALAAELAAQRPWETVSTMHGEVEASLDAIILRRETGMLPSQVNVKQMFPKNESAQRRIAKLYHSVLLSACGEDVPEGELLRATNDAHFVFSLLNDRTGLKRQVFQRMEKGKPSLVTSHIVPITEEDGVDFANIQHSPWGTRPRSRAFSTCLTRRRSWRNSSSPGLTPATSPPSPGAALRLKKRKEKRAARKDSSLFLTHSARGEITPRG